MRKFFMQYWNNEAGFIVSAEMLFLYTITVLGLIVGMTNVQRAIITEFTDVANSLLALDQSYSYVGFTGQANNSGNTITASVAFTDVTYTVQGASAAVDYVNFANTAAAVPIVTAVVPTP